MTKELHYDLKEYLNRVPGNYFETDIVVRVEKVNKANLDARQFKILARYLKAAVVNIPGDTSYWLLRASEYPVDAVAGEQMTMFSVHDKWSVYSDAKDIGIMIRFPQFTH